MSETNSEQYGFTVTRRKLTTEEKIKYSYIALKVRQQLGFFAAGNLSGMYAIRTKNPTLEEALSIN